MKKIPRIAEILKVEPYKVTVRWTTGELRVVDFEELFSDWGMRSLTREAPLLDAKLFVSVRLSEDNTLEWPVLIDHLVFEDDTVVSKQSPLSFDPLVLYEASHPIENYRLVAV